MTEVKTGAQLPGSITGRAGGQAPSASDGMPSAADAVILMLAAGLERLAGRILRDLNADASEGTPPGGPDLAGTIAGLMDCARDCARLLDDPQVTAVLAGDVENLPEATWNALADLAAASAVTQAVLASPGTGPAERTPTAGRQQAALAHLARRPGGLMLLEPDA
jgi:hypothetical protein